MNNNIYTGIINIRFYMYIYIYIFYYVQFEAEISSMDKFIAP